MKNVLRDWLGINEEKYQLELEIDRLRVDLANKDANLEGLDDELQDLRGELETIKYEVEDKITYSDAEELVRDLAYCDIEYVKNDLEGEMDYSEMTDKVFDLVMEEIKNRDTLQSLVEDKLNAMADEGRGSGGDYSDSMVTSIIEDVTDDVMEKIIYKLRA
tara:strand:+ start:81 stop:563 length:483 start_codon:yes stop_codon:yes gene_type:complete